MQFPFDSSATAQSPESRARGTLCLQGPVLRYEEWMHILKWAAPRRNLAVPLPLPCREQDVDRRRVDPGEAPKLEPVFGLHHCPSLPPRGRKSTPFMGPSFSLGCCKRLAGSGGWSWGQAPAGPEMSEEFGFRLGLCGESAAAPPCPSLGASMSWG